MVFMRQFARGLLSRVQVSAYQVEVIHLQDSSALPCFI